MLQSNQPNTKNGIEEELCYHLASELVHVLREDLVAKICRN